MATYLKNQQISAYILKEIEACKSFQIAVAWATSGNAVFQSIIRNGAKLDRLVVGISFCKTDPNVFNELNNAGLLSKCRYYDKPNQIFHPKVYFFNHEDNKWSAIIGSANLTSAAFCSNVERAVYLEGIYAQNGDFEDIFSDIDDLFNNGAAVTSGFIRDYSDKYEAASQKQKEEYDKWYNYGYNKGHNDRLIDAIYDSLGINCLSESYKQVLNDSCDFVGRAAAPVASSTPLPTIADPKDAIGRIIHLKKFIESVFLTKFKNLYIKPKWGVGNWSHHPNIYFFDLRETDRGTEGIYALMSLSFQKTHGHDFLFAGIKISLTQGKHKLNRELGANAARNVLAHRARESYDKIKKDCLNPMANHGGFDPLPASNPVAIMEKFYPPPITDQKVKDILEDLDFILKTYECLINATHP